MLARFLIVLVATISLAACYQVNTRLPVVPVKQTPTAIVEHKESMSKPVCSNTDKYLIQEQIVDDNAIILIQNNPKLYKNSDKAIKIIEHHSHKMWKDVSEICKQFIYRHELE